MSRGKGKSKTKSKTAAPKARPGKDVQSNSIEDVLSTPKSTLIIAILLLLGVILLYKPMALDGMGVNGSDVVTGIGNTHQWKVYEAETGEKPLWNPYMFGGMPIYHRHSAVSFSLDSLFKMLDPLLNLNLWFLWIGALGMLVLCRYLGFGTLPGLAAAIGLLLIPHMHALIVVGHFSKLRALMYIPWVMLSFLWLIRNCDLTGMFLFTASFGLQLRTQHYQIVFYTILLLFAIGIAPYIQMILKKQWPAFLRLNAYFVGAIALVVMIVAQPLFVTNDYVPHSTRGGNAVNINETQSEEDKQGVGFDYATGWSYTAAEFWNLVIPKFHGGTSTEVYDGDAVSQLKGQRIPAYWGDLPITQSYEYIGILVVLLAIAGIVLGWQLTLVKSLALLTVFALALSLGKHFAPLYKLFFYYLPAFDKFRVPMMILTLVQVNACILAAVGLHKLMQIARDDMARFKQTMMVVGGLGIILIFAQLFGASMYEAPANEARRFAAQYGEQAPQISAMMKTARIDIMERSIIRTLLFFVAGGALVFAIVKQWIRSDYVAIGIIALILLDGGGVSSGYLDGKFVDLEAEERRTYVETRIDAQIKQDDSVYRVLPPLRHLGYDSRWTYHHQNIAGYSAAKLQVIQDLIDNNILHPTDSLVFNLRVANMLNAKYVVAERLHQHPLLEPVMQDPQLRQILYRNNAVLPRAWFVNEARVMADGPERLRFMNTDEFEPGHIALLEEEISTSLEAPDSSYASVAEFTPNVISFDVYTDKQALLVVSEVYYPEGWTAELEDGTELPIYKTNHILRSVVIPEGSHTVTMRFEPAAFSTGVMVSWLGWIITYLGLGFVAYQYWQGRSSGASIQEDDSSTASAE